MFFFLKYFNKLIDKKLKIIHIANNDSFPYISKLRVYSSQLISIALSLFFIRRSQIFSPHQFLFQFPDFLYHFFSLLFLLTIFYLYLLVFGYFGLFFCGLWFPVQYILSLLYFFSISNTCIIDIIGSVC